MSAAINSDVPAVTAETIAAKIDSEVAAALSAADAAAMQRVQILGQVHQARVAVLTRTAADVTARFGAGSPQASAAQAAVTAAQGISVRVAVLSRQVSTKTTQAAPTGWALYGYVYDAQLQPVSAYCVFLVDQENAYQSAYGFAYTDASGYFHIDFAGASAPAGAAPPAPPQLFVEVANASAQPVFIGATPFVPSLGVATFRSITLPEGEKPIGNPPPAIRNTALPPAKGGA